MERGSTEAPNGTTVDEFVSKVRLAGASSPTSVFKPTLDSLGRIGALLKSWVSTDEPLVTKHYKERELDVLQEAMYLGTRSTTYPIRPSSWPDLACSQCIRMTW